jgi:antitoxin component of MazEF toxin-antitoxin module
MQQVLLRIAKVQRIGSSVGITLPAQFRARLGIAAGDYVRLMFDAESITIRSLDEKRIPHRRGPSSRGVGKLTAQ